MTLLLLLHCYYFRLGADVIYDPVCLPHLVRVLTILLSPMNQNIKHENGELYYNDGCNGKPKERPVAYIACVIRNIETFNYFLSLGDQANLDIMDLTDSLKPKNLLPYMQSYNQADIKLLCITCRRTNQTTVT